MIENLLKNLNDKQIEAVKETEGYVRVIAGAGSGKTKALTTRYAYIVECLGINSANILCVTFTNKAAEEMRRRVKAIIGIKSDVSLITTYHGFCSKFLREEIYKINYPKNFIILDIEDQKSILREVYAELNLTSKDKTFKQALREISIKKNHANYLDFILGNKKFNTYTDIDKVFHAYLIKQKKNFALDFDDLLNYVLFILDNNKDVLTKWQNRIHYIQVDETQDSSIKQFLLIELLARINKNLFIVGDPDQAIYEWRGAIPEILVNFDKKFTNAKTILMNQNYRSTPNILKLGNHIIRNNKIRVEKDMFTQNQQGVDVVHFHGQNETDEALWVINEIKELHRNEGVKYSDFAILYRANHVSRSIEQILIKENIPYVIYGGTRFFERKEIKDILAYLRLIHIGDDLSFQRVINHPARGLGNKFVEKISKYAKMDNTTLLIALQKNIEQQELNRIGAIDFLNLISGFQSSSKNKSISDLVNEILEKSGLNDYYIADGDTDRLENIQEFVNSIILVEKKEGDELNLQDYLQEISLYTDMDLKDDKIEKVKLMTIHTSKGLEFPYVFLCGFSEGILPNAMAIKDRKNRGIEEERRLAYVAITRAEKKFYMTESEGYNFNTSTSKLPSRFLFELDEAFYIRKGELNQDIIDEAKEFVKRETEKSTEVIQLIVGDMIKHPVWGKGKIIEVNSEKEEYIIEFLSIEKIKPISFSFKLLQKIDLSVSD